MGSFVTPVPSVRLNDGVEIPQFGYGTWQVPRDVCARTTLIALETGYRHIDTAAAYENEPEVGEAIRASGLGREEIFVTTKLWNSDHGAERARRALPASLERLGLDHFDLYLIHWPVPSRDLYVETWEALVALREEGLTRSIGVSNFHAPHVARIVGATGVTPSVDQVELHPRLQQRELRRANEERGIVTEAWSPLAQGRIFDEPVLRSIAEAHGRTVGQVVLRWHVQLGNVLFPKSVTPERIRENFDVWDFALSPEEMEEIAGLDAGGRVGPNPDTFALV